MKVFINIIVVLSVLMIVSCNNSSNHNEVNTDLINNPLSATNDADTSILPRFQWNEMVHDFGVVVQGERVSYAFRFKNVGKSNLVISSVHASCGCTVANYTKDPIAPGEEGKVEVIFDSSGRSGIQNKTVTVVANTQPNSVELHFTAEVVVPENN